MQKASRTGLAISLFIFGGHRVAFRRYNHAPRGLTCALLYLKKNKGQAISAKN